MDADTFWTDIFNSQKIAGKKDEAGKETIYIVQEIKAGDLKNDFKGLYEKLNNLKNTADSAKKQADAAKQAQEESTKAEAEKLALATKVEAAKKAQVEVQPYKDLYDGLIINTAVLESLKSLTLKDFINGDYRNKAIK